MEVAQAKIEPSVGEASHTSVKCCANRTRNCIGGVTWVSKGLSRDFRIRYIVRLYDFITFLR